MSAAPASVRVSIDTGGTFTDIVAIDEASGVVHTTKTPSTPEDPSRALLEGIRKIARLGGFAPTDVSTVVHGTTTATNAVLQRDFERLGLIVTRGFRHVLEIARQSVPDGYGNSYFWVKPPRPVTLERVCEVGGRLRHDGSELEPLVEEDIVAAADELRSAGVDCIAVCLLHSYADDVHERRVGELLAQLMPEAFVSLSCVVLPEYREYERAMTTILDVLVKPFTRDYLARADAGLVETVGRVPFLIMQSNGGVVSASEVGAKPITTLVSGPAAGVLAAAFIGERAGYRNLLTLDAGGTSTDVCLIEDLTPRLTSETRVDAYPVKTPMLDIVAVGTGGGSIARLEAHGSLKVGPLSAGADPGPICYGRGGDEPTLTDANLVLGRIPPHLLGGEVRLDVEAARAGLRRLAEPLGMTVEQTAAGVLEIAAWNQAHGIRQVTVQRGHDPAGYCLVAFGGSGGLLAGHVADALGIQTVLVPPNPGNVSAFGLQVCDVRRDYVRTLVRTEDDAEIGEIEAAWAQLEAAGRADLEREGVPGDAIELIRTADLRYLGEASECPVALPPGAAGDEMLTVLWDAFHDVHWRTFGFDYRGEQLVELVNLRVQAVGRVYRPAGEPATAPASGDAVVREAVAPDRREAWFGTGWSSTPIYDRGRLVAGDRLRGPAIVEEFGATTVVFAGWSAAVDRHGNLVLHKEA